MSHVLSSLLKQTSLQYLAHTSFSPSPPILSRSSSAPSLLPDSGEDVAQLRISQSKRKAHTTSKAAKPWSTGPPPHTSRTGKARKKGKKVSACTLRQNLYPCLHNGQWQVSLRCTLPAPLRLHGCAFCANQGGRPAPWALGSAVFGGRVAATCPQWGKKVLVQLTLISSAALTLRS